MPVTTIKELLDALRQFHLLEAKQLDELARKVEGKNIEPRALAQKLIEQDWLTPYQVNQLLQGRGQQLLLGSYILLDRLGEGGMGEVFKARHTTMGRTVAIKLIRKERLADAAAIKRFHREIRAASQLKHPNVVHAIDADQVGGTHLFVMEFIEGVDLARLVKEQGPLPVEQACEYVRQAALGLQHACEKGMVHRDIKPHNLLLAKNGTVKILDMGLARVARPDGDEDSSSKTLTMEGSVMGTVDYIAPEQAMDAHSVDIRADLYSLGCTLYFLLTSKVPFPGGDALSKLMRHKLEEPVPVEKLRPDAPSGVVAVVRKLMAKKPEDRYAQPAELAHVLASRGRKPAVNSMNRRLPPSAGKRRWALLGALAGCGLLIAAWVISPAFFESHDSANATGHASAKSTRHDSAKSTGIANEPGVQHSYQAEFQGKTPALGWQYLWNKSGAIGDPANYTPLLWDGVSSYDADGKAGPSPFAQGAWINLARAGGHPGPHVQQTKLDQFIIAAYTIQPGDGAGQYRIMNGGVSTPATQNGVEVLIHVNKQPPLLQKIVHKSETPHRFDTDLGTLNPGDTAYVALGPNGHDTGDTLRDFDFTIARGSGMKLVKDILVSNKKPFTTTTARSGAVCYIDRSTKILDLGQSLEGGTLIQTAHDDKGNIRGDYLSFTLAAAAVIYVVGDSLYTRLPAWLDDGTWQLTKETVTIEGQERAFKVYRKQFAGGRVTLGGANQAPSNMVGANYFVIVQPAR